MVGNGCHARAEYFLREIFLGGFVEVGELRLDSLDRRPKWSPPSLRMSGFRLPSRFHAAVYHDSVSAMLVLQPQWMVYLNHDAIAGRINI